MKRRIFCLPMVLILIFIFLACDPSDGGDAGEDSGEDSGEDAGADTDTSTPQSTDEEETDSQTEYPDVEPLVIGFPVFQVCLGVNHDYTALFGDSHEVMISDSYEQQELFKAAMDNDIENTAYAIGNFTMLDPSTAVAGKNAICITSMLMYDWEDRWHFEESHGAYQHFKETVGMQLVERVEKDFLPGLTQYIEIMEVITPHSLKGFTRNQQGSIFGWHPIPEQSLDNRMPQQTPISNLFLSSAWSYPGGGQSAVMSAGRMAGQEIMKRENIAPEYQEISFDDERRGINIGLLSDLGIWDKVTPVHGDTMYRAIYPDFEISVSADPREYLDVLKNLFPNEEVGLEALFQKIYEIEATMRIIFKFTNAGKDVEGDDLSEFMEVIVARGLTEVLFEVQELMQGTTLTKFLEPYIEDNKLIAVITQLAGFGGGEPDDLTALFFVVMWSNYHVGGYGYFEGGSQALSDAMAEVVEENGGDIRLHNLVTKIAIDDNGLAESVMTSDGACYKAKYVVSNANAPDTLLEMVGAEFLPTDDESTFHPGKVEYRDEPIVNGKPYDQTLEPDAITSATPGVESAIRTRENHPSGWKQVGCLASQCHQDAHGGNLPQFRITQCTTCHGSNGATARQAGHANEGCGEKGCHENDHQEMKFGSPDDCRACHRYEPPSDGSCVITETYDIVVIGAGGGGLSAAAYLSKNGFHVLVLEQHHRVGGYMSNFQRGEYRFEVSLHGFDGLIDESLPNFRESE